uniref:Regulator of telomere elongation helicase 1 n=1 Tax=Cyprinus carpio TaxID=7962 RepID=A0A8C1R5P6_CYPCA
TLCLLCSALGWRENFKDTISDCKIAERMDGVELFPDRPMSSRGTAVTNKDTPTYDTDIPKIIYASRTHSQLAQVINELKNTSYRPNICVLGSREQLCIDQEVMRQESNHIKKSTYKEIMNTIMDVEDLTVCSHRVCPYYLSRSLKQHADVIFMPYNYLLDPNINIFLKGAVVIFDEAHNIVMCVCIYIYIYIYIYPINNSIIFILCYFTRLKLDITTIAKIKQILMDLGSSINGFEMPANNQGITKPGSFIYELFQTANVNFENKTSIVEAMEQITGYIQSRANTFGMQTVLDCIQPFPLLSPPNSHEKYTFLQINQCLSYGHCSFWTMKHVHIHPVTNNFKTKLQTDLCASSSTKKQGNVLSYWCFSPGFSMQELLGQGVRSIILTSGTLSPLSSFTCEMKIPFPVSLENLHVIQPDQISVSIIEKGPDGVKLSTAFDMRFVPENMSSMGNTLVNLTRLVPHGLLVFFPSYPVMDKTLEFWRVTCFLLLLGFKMNEILFSFFFFSSGGSFFAVCRGKESKGLDFADTYCRGVVVTGLPFPPMMDPRVVLKMQYLDEMCKNNISGVKYLSGQEWYRQQAYRAVNQAIGRVIRHREDYGAIFLCDHRSAGTEACNQLPPWVRPYVKIYDNFGTMVRDVVHFFRTAQKTRPVPVRKEKAESSEKQADTRPLNRGSGCPHKSVWLSDTSRKAKQVDSHVPSLKRKKLESEEQSGSDGDAQMFIQYEMDIDRKPVSLLDVPDDTTNKVREDTMVGEERASHFSSHSLQHDKRLDLNVFCLLLFQKTTNSYTEKTGNAFIVELRRCLSHENLKIIMEALQWYKTTDDLSNFLANVVEPLVRETHGLLRGLYQFVRPHHKKEFDQRCLELTGKGCGYKPELSLSREDQEALRQNTAEIPPGSPPKEQPNSSRQLNQGGDNIGGILEFIYTTNVRSEDQNPKTSIQEGLSCSSLLSGIKQAIGAEKTHQLFSALQAYKNSNNYEQMVSTVVSLLTERNEDITILKRLSVIIPPQHRKQFSDLLKSLTGNDSVSQSKISSFS